MECYSTFLNLREHDMASVNNVTIIGNLGKDPEVKYMPSGEAVCNFPVACNEQWKKKDTGEKQEHTEWFRVAVFGKLAEVCGKYLTKGKQVYIEGKLRTRSYEKDGETKYSTELICSEMKMLGVKDDGNEQPSKATSKPSSKTHDEEVSFDDDIPF